MTAIHAPTDARQDALLGRVIDYLESEPDIRGAAFVLVDRDGGCLIAALTAKDAHSLELILSNAPTKMAFTVQRALSKMNE